MVNSPFAYSTGLTATLTTNLLQPAAAGSGTGYTPTASYIILRHIRVLNNTAGDIKVALWKGGSAGNVAGTEFAFGALGVNVPANSFVDWFGYAIVKNGTFIVGGQLSGSSNNLTINFEGEMGLVP